MSYIAVIFTSTRRDSDHEEYAKWSGLMSEMVKEIPGFLGSESFRDSDTRKGVTIAYFEDEAAVKRWREVSMQKPRISVVKSSIANIARELPAWSASTTGSDQIKELA